MIFARANFVKLCQTHQDASAASDDAAASVYPFQVRTIRVSMDLRPILVRYRLQLTGGEHLFFALGGGNILFHTPNVGINCTDFLAHAKTWVCAFSAARALIIATSATHIAVTSIVFFIFLHSLLASTIILGRPWTYP